MLWKPHTLVNAMGNWTQFMKVGLLQFEGAGNCGGGSNLEILYHARGEEIKRLKFDLNDLAASKETDVRQLRHEVALLKAENGRLKANLVTFYFT
jgi:uncharacterized small protein (DUF1192 family)